jgi:hypothetical protein
MTRTGFSGKSKIEQITPETKARATKALHQTIAEPLLPITAWNAKAWFRLGRHFQQKHKHVLRISRPER